MKVEIRHKILRSYLYVIGFVTLLAFPAATMPRSWMIWIADLCGIEGFPDHPLTWYLARHLSVLYGVLGIAVVGLANAMPSSSPTVFRFGWVILTLGILQLVIALEAPMPTMWAIGEPASTIFGGLSLAYLARR